MNVSQASKIWLDYHRAHSKHNTGLTNLPLQSLTKILQT